MHFVNGQAAAGISVHDRGLTYGQTLFETVAIQAGQPLLMKQHFQRLSQGCQRLSIPLNLAVLKREIKSACATAFKKTSADRAVMRLTVSMGEGGRGYQNPDQPKPLRILSFSNYPDIPKSNWESGIVLGKARIRLAHQPDLAGLKHGNRLEQIIARSQWDEAWQEAILLDQNDYVIEATQANIFTLKNNILKTPDLKKCGVAGVMRDYILRNAARLGVIPQTDDLTVSDLELADAVFVCNSLIGAWPVKQFYRREYDNFELYKKLQKLLRDDGVISLI